MARAHGDRRPQLALQDRGVTYDDPRLAAIYDTDNPAGADHAYYRSVADRTQAEGVVDLGCGTGLLTVTLAGPRRHVIGIDSARAMLDYAASRPGGDGVVTMQCHNDFLDHGGSVDISQRLQFRSLEQLGEDLGRAGLSIRQTWSDWHRNPFAGRSSDTMIVIEATF